MQTYGGVTSGLQNTRTTVEAGYSWLETSQSPQDLREPPEGLQASSARYENISANDTILMQLFPEIERYVVRAVKGLVADSRAPMSDGK